MKVRFGVRGGIRFIVIVSSAAAVMILSSTADARHHQRINETDSRRSARGEDYTQSQSPARCGRGHGRHYKTGYTRASGFNLVASVHQDGRRIVAVVLGGKSSFERDVHMRRLISAHIQDAALRHTSPVIYPDRSLVSAKGKLMTDVVDPVLPVVVKTFTVQTAPQQAIPSGSSLATPTISPDASEPSAQVAARWPSTAEAFTPIAGSPSVGSRSYRSASPVLPSDSPIP
jgi:D-alanyl-D-alanine carboxypeptidase